MDSGGGWYNSRKQYRSVAFGTWKPGAANKLFQKSQPTLDKIEAKEEKSSVIENRLHPLGYNTIAGTPRAVKNKRGAVLAWNSQFDSSSNLCVKDRKMGESSPNLTRINNNSEMNFPPIRPLDTSLSSDAMNRMLIDRVSIGSPHDCYSSTEYVAYLGRKASEEHINDSNGNPPTAWSGTLPRATDRTYSRTIEGREKNRLESSIHRVHHRSQSAGADGVFRVHPIDMRSPLSFTRADASGTPSNTRFLRATKKFFKKIYSTATLPKKHSTTQSTENFTVSQPFFDLRYREPPRLDDSDESYNSYSTYSSYRSPMDNRPNICLSTSLISYPKYPDIQYPDSGVDDRSSTPDHSVESMPITSKSESPSSGRTNSGTMSDEGNNWNDVFEHLKKEISLMRERDQQILADLHRVEDQLKSVRLNQLNASYNDLPDKDDLHLGDLIPSMPL